jgi:hypothetical protein
VDAAFEPELMPEVLAAAAHDLRGRQTVVSWVRGHWDEIPPSSLRGVHEWVVIEQERILAGVDRLEELVGRALSDS